jgi:phenylalanyl-tRNA synthetase alpha chain
MLSYCGRRRQLLDRVTCQLPRRFSTSTSTTVIDLDSPDCNVPPHIADRVLSESPKLYQLSRHPLYTIKKRIENYFPEFLPKDSLSPIVSTTANFDSLLIPPDHVSRSKSDTYYLNATTCLRTHTSAHQVELLQQGHTQFLCTGDVYRRDDIDKSHYPIFHQMEGVCVFDDNKNSTDKDMSQDEVLDDLKHKLEGLAQHLFGPVECRWVDEYFPFTHPSAELEIWYQDEWLEVLGCGVMQPKILQDGGLEEGRQAWAFGLGLERLAMVLFEIPDIRLFWSQDDRFWNQFREGEITKFQPYSKYPPCLKDVSFWINTDNENNQFHVNEMLDLTRQVAGDLVELVELVDQFTHPKTQRQSHCYRITYRSMDRSLTNEEIDILQDELRTMIQDKLPVELR